MVRAGCLRGATTIYRARECCFVYLLWCLALLDACIARLACCMTRLIGRSIQISCCTIGLTCCTTALAGCTTGLAGCTTGLSCGTIGLSYCTIRLSCCTTGLASCTTATLGAKIEGHIRVINAKSRHLSKTPPPPSRSAPCPTTFGEAQKEGGACAIHTGAAPNRYRNQPGGRFSSWPD